MLPIFLSLQMGAVLPIFLGLQIGAMLPIWGGISTEKYISDRLGSSIGSPCSKPIWDSSENSSQAKPFITNQPYPSPVRLQPCHRVHSISYLRQQMQRCISFPIPGNRCRTSGLYNCAVSPALGRTSSFFHPQINLERFLCISGWQRKCQQSM